MELVLQGVFRVVGVERMAGGPDDNLHARFRVNVLLVATWRPEPKSERISGGSFAPPRRHDTSKRDRCTI